MMQLAYITLRRGLFDKHKWYETFLKHPEILSLGMGYKNKIVNFAIHGHFALARFIRTLISHLKL